MADEIYGVLEWKLAVLRTGNIFFEIGYTLSPEDALAGRIQWLQVAMSVEQTRTLADDLHQTAASSRQTTDTGQA